MPSPQPARVQLALQVAVSTPSSQLSPASTMPLPQMGAMVLSAPDEPLLVSSPDTAGSSFAQPPWSASASANPTIHPTPRKNPMPRLEPILIAAVNHLTGPSPGYHFRW